MLDSNRDIFVWIHSPGVYLAGIDHDRLFEKGGKIYHKWYSAFFLVRTVPFRYEKQCSGNSPYIFNDARHDYPLKKKNRMFKHIYFKQIRILPFFVFGLTRYIKKQITNSRKTFPS